MAKIGFIGIGNMGLPMACNLINAGHDITVFDLSQTALETAKKKGAHIESSIAALVKNKDVVISMLPKGEHVRTAYQGPDGALAHVDSGTLFIDCSTIDVATSRELIGEALAKGCEMVDAPVSGGVGGAEAATLTFMVGGALDSFERAEPILSAMGKNVIHAGAAGNGQVAKICNNMVLAVHMIGVSEAFSLAEKLGLDAQTLYDITSTSSAQCWSLTSYCPAPGPVPTSPANSNYQAGFTVANMLKDLNLSQEAAESVHAMTPLGHAAMDIYKDFAEHGNEALDFSAIIKALS